MHYVVFSPCFAMAQNMVLDPAYIGHANLQLLQKDKSLLNIPPTLESKDQYMPKITIALRAVALAGAFLFALSGCGSGSDNDRDTRKPDNAGTIVGRVVDAQTGEAIAGVEVSIGNVKTTSDASGKYSLLNAPTGTVVAQFAKPTYASNFATVDVIASATSTADRRLAKVAVRQDVSAATGGTVVLTGSSAQVDLPAAGFVNAAGAAVTGTVSVEMTPIDPGVNPLNMPGNYRAQGEATPIESFGALQVELRDASGAMLNLAPGKTATIRIPVPKGAVSPPLSIPLYYFKESTGLWVREGEARLAGDVPQQYYEGQVSHFTTWNADKPYDTMYISGCVVNSAGQPVNATVVSEGIDYFGTATVAALADGKFKVAARRSSQVQVNALSGGSQDSVVVTTGQTDMTLPACLVVAQKPPVIVTQPISLTLAPGFMNTLSVTANNAEQYKWYRNGVLIDSGSRYLTVFGSASAAGTYHVVVSNAHGSVTSSSVTVTVAAPATAPVIVSSPQDVSVLVGATPSFTVQSSGASLTYQWLRNGVAIASAQGPTLTLGPVSAGDNGALFSVRVTNAAGTIVSGNAVLSITAAAVAPSIATQPVSASVAVGQSAAFAVVVTGTEPFTFQWLRNGAAIADATASSYTTPATTLADTGTRYSVRVTNSKGNVLSSEAILTVSQGSSIGGLHLAFPTGLSVGGQIGYGAIPVAGGAAVPFWPAGTGEVANYLVQGQLNNGVASNIHISGMMFWKNQQLIRRDLIGANGLPAEVRVSSLTGADLCGGSTPDPETVGADLLDINLSWYVYRKRGADATCNTADDGFAAVRANMTAVEAPLEVNHPVASIHSATGALTGWLVRNGQLMQRVSASFTGPVTLFTLPGNDLDVDEDANLDNQLIFESGKKVYAVNLAAPAPASLTVVATLADDESLTDVTYANNTDAVISVSNNASTRVLRFMTSTKTVNAVATVGLASSWVVVTPTRAVLSSTTGTLTSVLLSGGAAQVINPSAAPSFLFVGQRGGERLWYEMNGNVLSLNSDGSGMQTLQGAKIFGCIYKPLSAIGGTFPECDAVIVLDGSTVRSYDATTGAVRITYGNITLPAAPLLQAVGASFLTAWGQTGVLSQYIFNPSNANAQSVVSYLIKTDTPGITQIVMP